MTRDRGIPLALGNKRPEMSKGSLSRLDWNPSKKDHRGSVMQPEAMLVSMVHAAAPGPMKPEIHVTYVVFAVD